MKRNYQRRTIHSPSEGCVFLRELQELLGIRHRDTLNKNLKALGLFGLHTFNWEQIREILGMSLWLRRGNGNYKFSRKTYLVLKKLNRLGDAFFRYGIEIDKEFEEIRNRWNTNKTLTKF